MEAKVFKIKNDKMTTVLSPTDRKDFKFENEFEDAYEEWKKMFDYAMKDVDLDE